MDIQSLLTKWHIRMTYTEILERWREPHRVYHTTRHLDDLLQQIGNIPNDKLSEKQREKLIITALFHDIIYDPRRNDNEERSAQLLLQNVPDNSDVQHIVKIINDTKTHNPTNVLSSIFCELDMSIVRKSLPELLEWETGIRAEYSHIPRIFYVAGRTRFLQEMIQRYPCNANALHALIDSIIPWWMSPFIRCLV